MSTVGQRFDEHWAEIVKILRIEGTPSDRAWVFKEIEELTGFMHITPGKRKAQLDRIAKEVGRFLGVIENTDPSLRLELGITDRYIKQVNLKAKIRRLRPPTVARSGNAQRMKALKRKAAFVGFNLVFDGMNNMPTLTINSPYLRVTAMVLRIVTGDEPGDVYRACSDHLSKYAENEAFSPKERRKLHKLDKEERKKARPRLP